MSDTLRFNWRTEIICIDCEAVFEVTDPDPTKELVNEEMRTRWVMLRVPNECPKCHNIRVISGGKDKKEETADE